MALTENISQMEKAREEKEILEEEMARLMNRFQDKWKLKISEIYIQERCEIGDHIRKIDLNLTIEL